MRLDGDDDEILLAGVGERLGYFDVSSDDVVAFGLHAYALAANRVRMGAIRLDEGDLFARERQPRAEHAADRAGADDSDSHAVPYSKRLVSVPMPSIATSIVLPGFIFPAPTDVPQAITSPGISVMSREIALTRWAGFISMSLTG